jgi:hypothetical protein
MQATGLRTGQPAMNRGIFGALLALVAGGIVALVIVWAITRSPGITVPASGLVFDAPTRANIEFRTLEPAAAAAMLKESKGNALTPAEAAAQRDAVRHFHQMQRANAASALSSSADAGK